MASYAKRASPTPADPPADDAKDTEPEEPEVEEKEEEEPQPERKRGRRKKREAEKAAPATPTVERPSRERKTVERYSELTPRAAPAKKSPAILQGSGTKLKDIPNVSFKLSKRKADENLQSLHTLMAPLPPKRPKAASSPSPSPSDSGSDSDLHDHSDPQGNLYFARSGVDDEFDQDSSYNEEEENHDDADGEMGELEKEYRIHQANHQNILKTLKQHRDDDVSRGQAVKNQKALWDKTLEMRFLLQKAFSTSNKLPKEPIKSRFCNHDKEVEKAYADLLDSSKQTLGCMLDLQEALLERNQAAKGANEMSSDSNGENDEWSEVQKLQRRITPFRNSEIDKWQRKTMVTTGAAALKGKLHAFNQNISDQVTGHMRDPSRMINRMYVRKSTVGVFGEDVGEPGTTRELLYPIEMKILEHNLEGDPELIDDSEFYQQLLKEFLESCDTGASESAFYALRKQQHKKRKLVDRRASKSRKIRYHVHEKIANFMAPVPMVLPPMAPKLFENLFGMGNQKPTTV